MALTASELATVEATAGGYKLKVLEMVTTAAAAADEGYVIPGAASVIAVLGAAGNGPTTQTFNFLRDADDTAGTSGETPGSLGVETSVANQTFHVLVLVKE